MRHTAHTSEVDAPQATQGERSGAGDDMAAMGAGGQREAREDVEAARATVQCTRRIAHTRARTGVDCGQLTAAQRARALRARADSEPLPIGALFRRTGPRALLLARPSRAYPL